MAKEESKAVTKVEEENKGLVVADDFFEGAGEGHEDFSGKDFTVPFIGILQALSKPLQRGHAKFNKDAQQGMFINSATGKLYPAIEGEAPGIIFVPCYFHHRYVAWKPSNGGIAHDYGTDPTIYEALESNEQFKRLDPEGNEVIDTMEYFGLIVNPETGEFEPAVIPFSKVFTKKAKKWNNMIRAKVEMRNGKPVKPAIYFYAYQITTVPESNDKGNWWSHEIKDYGKVPELPNGMGMMVFRAAQQLRQSVVSGELKAAVEEPNESPVDSVGDGEGAF